MLKHDPSWGTVRAGGNHLRYLVLLLWYTTAPPYRHCALIKLLWARVALFLLVFEHDLTMDALLENGLRDIVTYTCTNSSTLSHTDINY